MAFNQKRLFNDAVHGHILLPENLFTFIDTPEYQRLRAISQLGYVNRVYPGATHSRFEHGIGTAYIAEKYLLHLKGNANENSEEKEKFVPIAGLCHDIGHGPFSHTFDDQIIPYILKSEELKWSHEKRSCEIVEKMIDNKNIEIDRENIKFIQNLILPKYSEYERSEKKYLYEIVSNPITGIDVDKFDYIKRDCHYTGIKSQFNHSRLMKLSRIIEGRICFSEKAAGDILELFETRLDLHRKVYHHKTVISAELMLADVFLEAEHVLKIGNIYQSRDLDKFLELDEMILNKIKTSKKNSLKKAKNLLKRIDCRNLYKLAVTHFVKNVDCFQNIKKIFSETKIASYCEKINENEIIIYFKPQNLKIYNWGGDPISNTKIFKNNYKNELILENLNQKENLINTLELKRGINVYIYSKNPDQIERIKNE